MFKFLKDKLKKSISLFSKKVDEVGEEKVIEEERDLESAKESENLQKKEQIKEKLVLEDTKKEEDKEQPQQKIEEPQKEGFFKRLFSKKREEQKKDIIKISDKKEIKEDVEQILSEPKKEDVIRQKEETIHFEEKSQEEKRGFFGILKEKVVTKKISSEKFDELFWDLEVTLLENNVAVEVIDKIKNDLKQNIIDKPIKRNMIEETIILNLKKSIEDILAADTIDILERMKNKKPYVICFVGINGSGKTTTIAKIAKMLLDNNKKIVLAAADTFRAAAIDQLQVHADNLSVKMIRHDYGSDPAAVAFDAIKYAQARNIDAVLIDTAGRLHSNINLIDEMKKIIRVAKPDLKLFVGEAITGNDCIEQAIRFNEAIDIDGIILAKADIDEKGGASISVGYVTKKPILFLGTGQNYSDIKPFDKYEIIKSLGLEA